MSITYTCHHLDSPKAPLPPSYPSSSSSQYPLRNLYFCEECDAIRCDLCVAVEVASYFCPNCLFDVPSANVRGDRNRSCFSCPQCSNALQVQAVENHGEPSSTGPFLLQCTYCKWSSRKVNWEFEKPSGLSSQLGKMNKRPEQLQSQFDALKEHLDGYVSHTTTTNALNASKSRVPSRHISHLTQMAAKALHKDVPGLAASSRSRLKESVGISKAPALWDDLGEFTPKESWRDWGLEHGDGTDEIADISLAGPKGLASLESKWSRSQYDDLMMSSQTPERIKLLTKLTKRCPHPSCRHLLIQPDTKTTRFKIKMVAANYLPLIEIGHRRRKVFDEEITPEHMERLKHERRRMRLPGRELEESMNQPLKASQLYLFQLAFTNPLFDPIQIRLTQPHSKSTSIVSHQIHIPTPHFTINALKDAWAYDEDDDGGVDILDVEGTEATSDSGGTIGTAKKARISVLDTPASSLREKKRDTGIEKKANVTKINIDVEIAEDAKGDVEFDLEVRYTYRDESAALTEKSGTEKSKEGLKTFTFWVRVNLGPVV